MTEATDESGDRTATDGQERNRLVTDGGTESASDSDVSGVQSGALRRDDEDRAEYVFWADEVADAVEARNPDEPITIKGGISPSGVPHLGNANEIMRGYYVAEVLRERGHEVRQVFTTDDRDPLRKLPRKLADLDGNIVELGDVNAGALGRNLGRAYTDIPDPFGCCDSYGEHFSTLIDESAELLGADIDVVSTTELYESGRMDDVVEHVLRNREQAREVLAQYQDKVDADYVPFNPFCAECGKVTETVTAVDVDARTVDYRCTDVEAGERTIEGCGHEGTATFREGKLPWRFEWPAQWQVLGVDHEPFGKDHAEGSWPSGQDIAENVLDVRPPVPMVYEWFTLDGEPFSSSAGNVVLTHDVLEFVEPEVLRYFFSKNPTRARDFSVENVNQLVDEFDRFEATYYGERTDVTDKRRREVKRIYPLVVGRVDPEATDFGASWKYQHLDFAVELADAVTVGRETRYDGSSVEATTDVRTAGQDDGGDGATGRTAEGESLAIADRVTDLVAFGPGRDARVTLTEPGPEGVEPDPTAPYAVRDALVESVFADRVRIPYTFAAVLGMTDDPSIRASIARKEGHVPTDAPEWAVADGFDRIERAREWARRTGNEFDYELKRADRPAADVDEDTASALDDLAAFVAEGHDGEAIQGEIYEAARRHDVDVGDFFATGYRLFFDDTEGPQLGTFLGKLDREFVVERLRREG